MRSGEIPNYSKWNNMHVENIPKEFENMTKFDWVNVQKVKPLKKTFVLETVANKDSVKKKNKTLAKGVKGNVVYMPIPNAANMNKIGSEYPGTANTTNFILNNVTNVDKKFITQYLVNYDRINNSLKYLIANNDHYKDIEMIPNEQAFYKNLFKNVITVDERVFHLFHYNTSKLR